MRASFLGVAREGRAGPPPALPGVDVVVNVGVARAGRGKVGNVMAGVRRRRGSEEEGGEGKRRRVE